MVAALYALKKVAGFKTSILILYTPHEQQRLLVYISFYQVKRQVQSIKDENEVKSYHNNEKKLNLEIVHWWFYIPFVIKHCTVFTYQQDSSHT